MAVEVGPPTVGPEPPGLASAVSRIFRGEPVSAAPGMGQPDPYAILGDPVAAVKLLTDTRKFCEPGREAFEWGWWRALLYFLGRQWIYWNPSSRTWNDKRLAAWIPKPVTNKVRETFDTIFALLADVDLGVNARPVGQEPKNILTAETVDNVMPAIDLEHEMADIMGGGDFWAIILGNAFFHPHWDKNDQKNKRVIDLWSCQVCQTQGMTPDVIVKAGNRCPNCKSQALIPQMKPDGSKATQLMTIGRGRTIVASPLELLMPLYAQSWQEVDRLIFTSWKPRHEIEEENLDPKVVSRIQWTTSPQQRSLQLYRSLAMQSDLPMSPQVWNTNANMNEIEGVTEQILWIRANRKYEQGVYLRFLGDGDAAVPVYAQNEKMNGEMATGSTGQTGGSRPEIPYKTNEGVALWPWVNYAYKKVRGRLFAQGAVDPIIQKQDQINQIDSMTILVATRMGNPVWLEPKGAEVERFTGQPGLIVRWQPAGANSHKPERLAGENPPQSFFALRQQYIADIEDLTGTYDVVKGSKPSGIEAFSALQLLVERSQSRFTPVFKSRGGAYRGWAEIAIELERVHGPNERVINTLGPNRTWTQEVFQRAKLQGAIEIIVEDGSNIPKTALGRRAAMEHANQLQLLSPQVDQDQKYAMMQELGLTSLIPSLDAFVKSALQEQAAFEEWAGKGFPGLQQNMAAIMSPAAVPGAQTPGAAPGAPGSPDGGPAPTGMGMQPPPQVSPLQRMPWHNDIVHLQENQKWMNGDRVREILANAGPMAPAVVKILGDHLMAHQLAVMQQQALMQPPPSPDQGSSKPGQGSGKAMENSNRESGSPKAA